MGVTVPHVDTCTPTIAPSSCDATPPNPIIDISSITKDPIWAQMALPMELGGLNLRSLGDISDAAFVASWAATAVTADALLSPHLSSLVTSVGGEPIGSELPLAYESLAKILFTGQRTKTGIKLLQQLQEKCGIGRFGFGIRASRPGVSSDLLEYSRIHSTLRTIPFRTLAKALLKASTEDKVQRLLTSIIHEAKYETLLERARISDNSGSYGGMSDVIRLKALRLEGSSAFIQAFPINSGTTYQKNSEVLTMLAIRLGLPLPDAGPIPKTCPYCSSPTDPRGYHFSVCRKRPIAAFRHRRLQTCFKDLLPSGSDIREEIHGTTTATASRRPIDLAYDMQDGSGRRAGVDFTITYPSENNNDFRFGVLKGMKRREKEKINNLNGSVNTSAIHYVPLVFTIFGGIGPAALEHFKELAGGWSAGSKVLRDRYLRIMKLKVSSCIQLNHASLSLRICSEAVQKAFYLQGPNTTNAHPIFRPPITPAPSDV